ncbi:uncharacterized protein LOC106072985 isoform X3 [Biomphalaria glabrata]|uniref:Uncharacterized protein LOC106072985 isoform X3 n=1 Tax=Biomphalaria glabrata TaxID=6526 RepID=A0A9W2Z6K7_BIOGL|nr:uncharacterized protein LOC106072985 isoform X3 [Biomphalaria glabrata]
MLGFWKITMLNKFLYLVLYLTFCFQSNCSLDIKIRWEKCYFIFEDEEEFHFEIFLNTAKDDDLDSRTTEEVRCTLIVQDPYLPKDCRLNITAEDCINKKYSSCGYCDQRMSYGYYIVMSFNISTLLFNSLQCFWRNENSTLELPGIDTNYFWLTAFNYTFTIESSLTELHGVGHALKEDYYSNYNNDMDNVFIYFGTENEQFTLIQYGILNQSLTSIDKEIIFILKWSKSYCHYVCNSVDRFKPNVTVREISPDSLLVTVEKPGGYDVKVIVLDDDIELIREDRREFVFTNYSSKGDIHETHNLIILLNNYEVSSMCFNAKIWNSNNTLITLSPDCPSGPYVKNGFIRRNTTASCRCLLSGETFPSASVQWFDATGLNVSQSGKYSDLIIDGSQDSGKYFCYVENLKNETNKVIFEAKFYDIPEVVNFTVNGLNSVSVSVGDTVTIYCQVKSTGPPSKAVLLASGLGSVKEIISPNETLELSLRDVLCEDSGRYNCIGRNGFEDNVTSYPDYVLINIKCPIKSVQKVNTIPTIRVSPNENTVFTFEVYGYPEPTQYVLKTETGQSTSLIDQSKYKVTFLRLTPPLGQITVTVYDAEAGGTITYILSVTNEAGEITLRYHVIKEYPQTGSDIPVSQIIGGCIGGLGGLILVSASIGISLWFIQLRRRKESPGYNERNDVTMPDIIQENRLQAEQKIDIEMKKKDIQNGQEDVWDAEINTQKSGCIAIVNVMYSQQAANVPIDDYDKLELSTNVENVYRRPENSSI